VPERAAALSGISASSLQTVWKSDPISCGNLQTDFPSAEAGKTAYYALRWMSTRGEKGPWSEVASATVAA